MKPWGVVTASHWHRWWPGTLWLTQGSDCTHSCDVCFGLTRTDNIIYHLSVFVEFLCNLIYRLCEQFSSRNMLGGNVLPPVLNIWCSVLWLAANNIWHSFDDQQDFLFITSPLICCLNPSNAIWWVMAFLDRLLPFGNTLIEMYFFFTLFWNDKVNSQNKFWLCQWSHMWTLKLYDNATWVYQQECFLLCWLNWVGPWHSCIPLAAHMNCPLAKSLRRNYLGSNQFLPPSSLSAHL